MASNELRNKTELTSVTGDEWVYVQESASPYAVKKVSITRVQQSGIIGKSLMFLNSYIPISATFPWLCLSLSDRTLTTSNYSADFIAEMRSRKIVYDETDTAVSAFSGSWSGSDFTLDNNAANIAMITELAEDWLFAGSPTSGWRILVSGGSEYNITNIVTSTRKITVSGSPSGTAIEIYLNRILGSTTSAKHFSWAGLGLYMTGQNKITGLRRRDKFQMWQLGASADGVGANNYWAYAQGRDWSSSEHIGPLSGSASFEMTRSWGQGTPNMLKAVSDGTNGDPRTGPKTEMESGTIMAYVFVGTYTA